MTHEELGRLLRKQTTPEFDAMPANKKMTIHQKNAVIRRTADRMAYELLLDCELPSQINDGHGYYIDEHWEIDVDDLVIATVERLANYGWEWEEGDGISQQIESFCRQFVTNSRYDDMVEEIRRGYYEAKYEDEHPYKSRGLSRSDF